MTLVERQLALFATALILSTSAYAQNAPKPPSVGSKPLVQVKPAAPVGCKLVGTVKGTKLWAGDCVASEQLRSGLPAAETREPPLPERAIGAIPSGQR